MAVTVSFEGKKYGAAEICVDLPLYYPLPMVQAGNSKAALSGLDELLKDLRFGNFQTDVWCIVCDRETPFRTTNSPKEVEAFKRNSQMRSVAAFSPGSGPPTPPWLVSGPFTVELICQRCSKRYLYFFLLDHSHLSKVGQAPSLEDISNGGLIKFRKLLGSQNYAELHRAGGLFSHGIGIGAFVYLRRIFERLVCEAQERLKEKGTIVDISSLPMDQKIKRLASELPRGLVDNNRIYGILSKGIHELDEATCKRFFPVVRAGIVQILEEHLQQREREETAKALRNEIAKLGE